jgi:hypothetical protein
VVIAKHFVVEITAKARRVLKPHFEKARMGRKRRRIVDWCCVLGQPLRHDDLRESESSGESEKREARASKVVESEKRAARAGSRLSAGRL